MKNKKTIIIIISIVLFVVIVTISLIWINIKNNQGYQPRRLTAEQWQRAYCNNTRQKDVILEPEIKHLAENEELILRTEDFFYTNKERNFTIALGMTKNEALCAAGPFGPWESTGNEPGEPIPVTTNYMYRTHRLTVNNEKLLAFKAEPFSTIQSLNWVSYSGINGSTRKYELFKILGESTYQFLGADPAPENHHLIYVFYKLGDGKYKKIASMDELKEFISYREKIQQMKVIWIEYIADELEEAFGFSGILHFGISYLVYPTGGGYKSALWSDREENRWWREYIEREFPQILE